MHLKLHKIQEQNILNCLTKPIPSSISKKKRRKKKKAISLAHPPALSNSPTHMLSVFISTHTSSYTRQTLCTAPRRFIDYGSPVGSFAWVSTNCDLYACESHNVYKDVCAADVHLYGREIVGGSALYVLLTL